MRLRAWCDRFGYFCSKGSYRQERKTFQWVFDLTWFSDDACRRSVRCASPSPVAPGRKLHRRTGCCWRPAGVEGSDLLRRTRKTSVTHCLVNQAHFSLFSRRICDDVSPQQQAVLTESLPDQVQLVHVRLPGPQRDPRQQLSEHAPDRPDVHRRSVLSVSHQQLGGPVPTGRHVVCVVVTWTSWWHRNTKTDVT